MPLVLAIEPDHLQSAVLKRIVREHVHADLILVDSPDAAMAALSAQIPDVILVSALLAPPDEEDLLQKLRSMEGGGHIQTYTIPQFVLTKADEKAAVRNGFFGKFRKKKRMAPIIGCDPDLFGQEIVTFVARANDLKSQSEGLSAKPLRLALRDEQVDAVVSIASVADEVEPPIEDPSSWASPFEWRRSESPRPTATQKSLGSGSGRAAAAIEAIQEAAQIKAERYALAQAERARLEALQEAAEIEAERSALAQAERARLDEENAREEAAREQERAEEARRVEAEEARRLEDARAQEELARLEAEAAAAHQLEEARRRDEDARQREEQARQREEEERSRLETDARLAAEARAQQEEEERLWLAAEADAAQQREEEERRRLEVEAHREREEEEARACLQAEAAVQKQREEKERQRLEEEERQRLEAETRREEEERARVAAEAAAQERREAEEALERLAEEQARLDAAAREQEDRERQERLAAAEATAQKRRDEKARKLARTRRARADASPSATAPVPSETPLESPAASDGNDQYADFREEHDGSRGLLRLMPVGPWARTESAGKATVDAASESRNDLRDLIAGLSVPLEVAAITYPRGCRIRRVRVRAVRKPGNDGPRRAVIVSRGALRTARDADRNSADGR